jgi:hypothetical protein
LPTPIYAADTKHLRSGFLFVPDNTFVKVEATRRDDVNNDFPKSSSKMK